MHFDGLSRYTTDAHTVRMRTDAFGMLFARTKKKISLCADLCRTNAHFNFSLENYFCLYRRLFFVFSLSSHFPPLLAFDVCSTFSCCPSATFMHVQATLHFMCFLFCFLLLLLLKSPSSHTNCCMQTNRKYNPPLRITYAPCSGCGYAHNNNGSSHFCVVLVLLLLCLPLQ